MSRPAFARRVRSERGQTMIEMAMMLPFMVALVLGMIELSYALFDHHVVTKLTREGSNLISRSTSLGGAGTALRNMSTRPVNFTNSTSKVIFSVVKRVSTTGASNQNQNVLYQRYEVGGNPGTSRLNNAGGSFGPGPEYIAVNSDNDTSLRVTNLPAGLLTTPGGMIYVTEIYTTHQLITPLNRFGINVPTTLYSIAYF